MDKWVQLVSESFHTTLYSGTNMKDSTRKFISAMRQRYGPDETVARGNILNFGAKVSFAIRNSKSYGKDTYWFAIQSDLIENKFAIHKNPPLGIHAALICQNEATVVIVPQQIITDWLAGSPSDRIHIHKKDDKFFLRVSGKPLYDVTHYVNVYPGLKTVGHENTEQQPSIITSTEQQQTEIQEHTRIQWMLIKFGRAAGYSVWVPPNDKGKVYNTEKFSDLTIQQLPNFGFDAITNQIVSNIDVLWFEGNVIDKAFEIESTTSVYSGLLRMSDLVLSQPNINIDLHIVAPVRRRDIVRRNILRPTFVRLRRKCSYISFEEVTAKYAMVRELLKKQSTRIRDLLESETF